MAHTYNVEYTDTFGGEANYCWVRRAKVTMPEMTYYGYDESTNGSYPRAKRIYDRELMRRAKAAVGITGARGRRDDYGDTLEFRPYRCATVMFVTWRDEEA